MLGGGVGVKGMRSALILVQVIEVIAERSDRREMRERTDTVGLQARQQGLAPEQLGRDR